VWLYLTVFLLQGAFMKVLSIAIALTAAVYTPAFANLA
jgi:hypothetical protein